MPKHPIIMACRPQLFPQVLRYPTHPEFCQHGRQPTSNSQLSAAKWHTYDVAAAKSSGSCLFVVPPAHKKQTEFWGEQITPSHCWDVGIDKLIVRCWKKLHFWVSALQDPPAAQSCGPAPPVKPHLCDMVQARTWPPSHSSGREKNAGVGWTEVRMPWAHYGTHLWWMQLWQIKVGLALVALHNALRLHYLCCNRGPAGPILSRKICLNQHSGWGMGNPTALVESQRTNQEINPLWQTPF